MQRLPDRQLRRHGEEYVDAKQGTDPYPYVGTDPGTDLGTDNRV